MPLIPAPYSNNIKSAYKKRSSARVLTAKKKATAFSQLIDKGVTAMGGIPVTSHGIAALTQKYVSIWKKNLSATLSAKKEAKAEHAMLKGAKTVGGKHGIGGWMSGDFNAYASRLGNLYKKQLPLSVMVIKEGKEKVTFIQAQIMEGKGVPPDNIPDISALS